MGRIDVHAHLLPAVDDGCKTLDDSLECAQVLVNLGYSHCFCTPHIWANLPHNDIQTIRQRTDELQLRLDELHIPLKLLPGGEINLHPGFDTHGRKDYVTYGLAGKYVLIDLWAERVPPFVEPSIRGMQSHGLTVVLAHPERMRAIQDQPEIADWLQELGVLLQGNLQCFADPPHMMTRRTAERFLRENRYFMLGSDLHGRETLPNRVAGFERVRSLIDPATFDRLTIDNPKRLLAQG